jgi:transcriptional regulator with XRE-family HTH domain
MSMQTVEAAVPRDTFELRLTIVRFHAGLNVKEAARRVNVSGQTWANWEAGKSAAARRPHMLSYIARQFGVDENWLREGGPLATADGGPGDGGLPRLDSNQRPSDYMTDAQAIDMAEERERRRSARGTRRWIHLPHRRIHEPQEPAAA